MKGEYGKRATWYRIGILLLIVALLVVLPALVNPVIDWFTESAPVPYQGFADVRGSPTYRLFDHTGNGRVDCALRVPSVPWSRTGYYRDQPGERCEGSRFQEMPAAMVLFADELLALRRQAGLSLARVRDLDGDGGVDCIEYDGTWRYAEGADCPAKRRSDTTVLSEDQRVDADRVLYLENELRSRWLGLAPATD